MPAIDTLLRELVERKGSDLHISTGTPPRIRVDGTLLPMPLPVLDANATKELIYPLLSSELAARFELRRELNFSFEMGGLGRFRTNVFRQRGAVGAVFRAIPHKIMSPGEVGLPLDVFRHICETPKGLVLITGVSGSGKSHTLASMLNYINDHRKEHIVTIEDPIEFVHQNRNCLVNQREVGPDTDGFGEALREVLRQDPDIVLIGEMRDLETIRAALTIAETGHLTFATLHTSDTVEAINRIIDVFPPHQQMQARTQLSFTLQAVLCQQLLPVIGGGRALCAEIMLVNGAIRAMIRSNNAHQIYSIIQTGGGAGMRMMNRSMAELIHSGRVSMSAAEPYCADLEDLRRHLETLGSPIRPGRRGGASATAAG